MESGSRGSVALQRPLHRLAALLRPLRRSNTPPAVRNRLKTNLSDPLQVPDDSETPPVPAFHFDLTKIWQQQRQGCVLGRESDGEAFTCVCVCCVCARRACTCAHMYVTYTHSLIQSHSCLCAFFSQVDDSLCSKGAPFSVCCVHQAVRRRRSL